PKVGLMLALAAGAVLAAAGVAQQVLSARQSQGDESPKSRSAADDVRPAGPEKERPAHADLHGDLLPEGAVARLGTVRFNHGDGLDSLLFSAGGKTVVSPRGGVFRLVDAAMGRATGER